MKLVLNLRFTMAQAEEAHIVDARKETSHREAFLLANQYTIFALQTSHSSSLLQQPSST